MATAPPRRRAEDPVYLRKVILARIDSNCGFRYFGDLYSNHHFDLPLCPICDSVLYLYEFNAILGLSTTRRLHKYVLKCNGRHVLPLLDLFCQTKKSGAKCNANFKLQWSYGTMVKRCEAQRVSMNDCNLTVPFRIETTICGG